MLGTNSKHLSPDEQRDLDQRLLDAAFCVQTDTVKMLLAAGANVHAQDDLALCRAAFYGDAETVRIFASNIFAPDAWRGKSRTEIEAHASALYDKIKTIQPLIPIQPGRLREAATILVDYALCCWEQIRPPPPPIQISRFPAQPRPV